MMPESRIATQPAGYEPLVGYEEAARFLGMPVKTFRSVYKKRGIPAYRVVSLDTVLLIHKQVAP